MWSRMREGESTAGSRHFYSMQTPPAAGETWAKIIMMKNIAHGSSEHPRGGVKGVQSRSSKGFTERKILHKSDTFDCFFSIFGNSNCRMGLEDICMWSRREREKKKVCYQGRTVWWEHWAESFYLSCRPGLAPSCPSCCCKAQPPRTPPPCSPTPPALAEHRWYQLRMETRRKSNYTHSQNRCYRFCLCKQHIVGIYGFK